MSLEIVPVASNRLHREFCDLPFQLYQSHPHWVAPIRSLDRRRWLPDHNSSLQNRWTRRFLAFRKGRVVGRVAAIIDEEFESRWVSDSGFFGFFECENDSETALGLLTAVEHSLHQQKKTVVLGPIDLTTHDEVGLLVAGHGCRPMVLSPYQPEYYSSLLRLLNYQPRCDYHSYSWSITQKSERLVERFLRRLERNGEAGKYVVKSSRRTNWDAETRLLHKLYNACFDEVWGFVPMSWNEFRERVDCLRRFYSPELVLFAHADNEPAGFALVLPDVNEALGTINGRLWPFGWLRLAIAARRIRSARFLLLGVLPKYRGSGISLLLASQAAATAQRLGIQTAELSLVNQDNHQVKRVIEAFGGKPLKTFRLFEKEITL